MFTSSKARVRVVGFSDATVIRLLDNTKAYVHAVIDNFSRRILAWKVSARLGAIVK